MTTEEKYLMLELCSKKGFRARMQEIADEAA
jgi:hypothetical protein